MQKINIRKKTTQKKNTKNYKRLNKKTQKIVRKNAKDKIRYINFYIPNKTNHLQKINRKISINKRQKHKR